MRTVAYYKGAWRRSPRRSSTSAPKVGLELVELESVTRCGAGDPWRFPRDADALIDYLERWEGSRPRAPSATASLAARSLCPAA